MKKKKKLFLGIIISNFFYISIFLLNISFINCECDSDKPFKLSSGSCVSSCTDDDDIFVSKACIPISTKDEDINDMYDKIVEYYKNQVISDKIVIGDENIKYMITTNILENNDNDSYLKEIINNCLMSQITGNYFIVIIDIPNTDYITSSKGIRIFNADDDEYFLSEKCKEKNNKISVTINLENSELALYKKIKNEYGYDIFNIKDKFYTDKCTKFTSGDNTDISLQKRQLIYGKYTKNVCSNLCTYQDFEENNGQNMINCICDYKEKKENYKIENEMVNIKIIKCYDKIGKDILKNYLLFIMAILSFLFLLCFIITLITLSSTISKYSENFDELKISFMSYLGIKQENKKKKEIIKSKKTKKERNDKEEKDEEEDEEENKEKKKEKKEEDSEKEEDENEEEESEEEENKKEKEKKSEESKETNINKNNENQNNFNMMNNNPYYNYYMSSLYMNNLYNPYTQYQMYNQYMMNYMKNWNNNKNEEEEEKEE